VAHTWEVVEERRLGTRLRRRSEITAESAKPPVGWDDERAVREIIVASTGLERALHFSVKVSPAWEAQRAGPAGRVDDFAGLGILPFSAIYIMKDMSCLYDRCQPRFEAGDGCCIRRRVHR
jgi:hypothetical protein